MGIDLTGAPVVRGPAPPTPARRPGSVRRTSTIDMRWPAGPGTQMQLHGRARDLLTPADGGPARALAEDVLHAGVRGDRTIERIAAEPPRPELHGLIGARGGGRLRGLLAEVVPREVEQRTPLNLLLDDMSGATLVGGFAFTQWPQLWPPDSNRGGGRGSHQRRMEGICIGFSPGSSALTGDGQARFIHDIRPVETLPVSDDELGWHRLEVITDVSMRRSRRIDVSVDEDVEIDAFFQDSATIPSGGRIAVHEYQVFARADLHTGRLLAIEADPRVLPYVECPLAIRNVGRLVGTPIDELRSAVPVMLKGTLGCTHLNDVLRALADVLSLARPLADAS